MRYGCTPKAGHKTALGILAYGTTVREDNLLLNSTSFKVSADVDRASRATDRPSMSGGAVSIMCTVVEFVYVGFLGLTCVTL